MEIQSLSICVPAGCPNDCLFCVAKIHRGNYPNQIENNRPFRHLYEEDYQKRMAYARDNGCNALIFTGDGEPMANTSFLEKVAHINRLLTSPFRMMELQTSGFRIQEENLRWLRNTVGITTISLSLSSLVSSENAACNQMSAPIEISEVCSLIKKYDFNLRLSLNMTHHFESWTPKKIFEGAQKLGADQITFRMLYTSGGETPQDLWIEKHSIGGAFWSDLKQYIKTKGQPLERLPFGAMRYSVDGLSVVVDDDCMSTDFNKEQIKYLILRENCKLYTKWDQRGSLLF